MQYISRMKVEMAVLAVKTINAQQDRAAMMVNTLEFSQWLVKNREVLVASHA